MLSCCQAAKLSQSYRQCCAQHHFQDQQPYKQLSASSARVTLIKYMKQETVSEAVTDKARPGNDRIQVR